MKLTIKQKQAIYEHLLTLDCPDLLAALIAERSDVVYRMDAGKLDESKIESWIVGGFDWFLAPEGHYFWNDMHDCVLDFEGLSEPSVDACFGYVVDDDIKTEGEPPVIVPVIGRGFPELEELFVTIEVPENHPWAIVTEPSLIDKVKLWFGKWSYKV